MYESRTRRTTDQDSVFEIVEVAYDRRSRVRFGTVSPMLVDLFCAQIRGCIGADFLISNFGDVCCGGGGGLEWHCRSLKGHCDRRLYMEDVEQARANHQPTPKPPPELEVGQEPKQSNSLVRVW